MMKFKYVVRALCVSGICAVAAGRSGSAGAGGPEGENTGTVKSELSGSD